MASFAQPEQSKTQPDSASGIALGAAVVDAHSVPEGERKQVTALFADIKGSTELMEDLDPEEARRVIDPALHLMMDAVHRYDGYVVQSTGDGIFALFGAPVAHEDHPQRALYAALRMQQELRRYSSNLLEQGTAPLELRIGANTGEVVVRSIRTGETHQEYTPIGHTTNLASRMQTLAPTGSIAVTGATQRLCEGYFTFRALGPTRVKGVSEPVNVHEVTGIGSLRTRLQRAAGRGLTKFVGREREIVEMRQALELARKGHGQIVAAMGDAGVGKSRLFHEFKAMSQNGCLILDTFSVSHGNASAYMPVMELLSNYFEIDTEDDARRRREKITGKVLTLDRQLENTLPHLFALLGVEDAIELQLQMDAQVRRRRTLDAVKRILLRESLNQPLIIIFEDLHWIDSETQSLLNLLVESIANARILMLVNYRPHYQHGWGSKTHYAQLRLDPLRRESVEELLSALLGSDADLQPLKQLIIEKTQCNPFFIEETVQVLLDEGTLVRNGTVKLTQALSELHIPPTVQAILASRIDRLPSAEKELLQTLAVMGKEFSLGLIRQVTGRAVDELERMLGVLQVGEFIYEQPAVPEVEYIFKHSLTQEVTYDSVLAERRRRLHERTGIATESLYAERLEDHLDTLAYHYGRSSDIKKAVKYLYLASRRAAQRSTYMQAMEYCTLGLKLLGDLPADNERAEQELALQAVLAESLGATKGLGAAETEHALTNARESAEKAGDTSQILFAMNGLQWVYLSRLDLQKARKVGEQFVRLAESTGDPAMLEAAHGGLGVTLVQLGEFAPARGHFERAFASPLTPQYENLPFDPATYCRAFPAWALLFLGYPDQALRSAKEALAIATKLSRPRSLANSLNLTAMVHLFIRDWRTAQAQAEEALAVASEYEIPGSTGYASLVRGWAIAGQGHLEEGIGEMRRGITALEAIGYTRRARLFAFLAELHVKNGTPEEGLKLVAEGLDSVESTGERMHEAELHRVKGDLLLMKNPGNPQPAHESFQRAITIARRQTSKLLELRAATSLARSLSHQGRSQAAYAMLTEIYSWFTEGFETGDLKDAKTLLDQLS